MLASAALLLMSEQLTKLAPVDILILVLYFALVVFIGFYAKGKANTSEDFFLAGREMTAWIAGLSFVSANLGSLELMGWAGAAYQYGILATHWYWIGAIPAMLFLGIVMMPFYYISKTHSVPGYLQLRFGEGARAVCGGLVRADDDPDERREHVRHGAGDEDGAGLEYQLLHLDWRGDGGAVCDAGWPAVGDHQRGAAVCADLGGRGDDPDPGTDRGGRMDEPEGADCGKCRYRATTRTCGRRSGHFKDNPMGVHWTGIVFGLGFVISFGYWTTDFLVVQRVLSANNLRAAKLAPVIGAAFKMAVPLIVILPGLLALAVLKNPDGSVMHLVGEDVAKATGQHSYNEVLPLMLIRYCGPGLLGLGITALVAGFMSGMAGNVSAFSTVWTYDIYGAFINKKAGYSLRGDGPVVDRDRDAGVDRLGIPGDACGRHHGLRAGAVQLLHRAAVRHGDSGDAVEAGDQGGRILGAAGGNCLLRLACLCGCIQARAHCGTWRCRRMQSRWPRTCTARCGAG